MTALALTVDQPGDTATSGKDYNAVSGFNLSIPKNQTTGTATFTFTPRDDQIIEGSETVTVRGTASGFEVSDATLTLTDDDTTSFKLSLSPSEVSETAGATTVTVTLSTEGGVTFSKPVDCNVRNDAGGAIWTTDYTITVHDGTAHLQPNTNDRLNIRIPVGDTSSYNSFTVTPVADGLSEGDEKIEIDSDDCAVPFEYRDAVDPEVDPAYLTILDPETAISLSVSPATIDEDAGATTVTVTAAMGTGKTAPKAMKVTITVGKTGDSATSGTDYKAIKAFDITIASGANSATKDITFTPIDDALTEGNETVSITGTSTSSVAGTSITIRDDDSTAITLSASPAKVGEGDGATTVTVTAATNGTTFPAAKTVTVAVGATTDSATEGTDYSTVADFDVSIAAGKTKGTTTFTLTPTDDSTAESDESISVSGTATGLTVNGTSVTINDNDDEITLSASPSSVTEDAGATTVTVTATMASGTMSADTAVTVSVGETGDEATSVSDYAAVSDFTLTIKSGKSSGTATFTLTPVDDPLYEGDEKLTINGSATGYRVGKTEVTIKDDDDDEKVTVSLSVKPKRVKECAGATTIQVTAELPDDVYTLPEDRKITLSVGKSTDGATSGTDYTAVDDFTLTIKAGQHTGLANFTLTPTDDTAKEGDETLSVHGTAKRLEVGNDAEVTIEDDDQDVIVLTMSPAKIPEQDKTTPLPPR